jgi:septum site-determining protein MinD
MTRIITFASGKGGTGKTTTVANLGTVMAQLGKWAVILDADITMSNLGVMLGLEGQKVTLHDVLAGKAKVSKAIYKGPKGVRVIPSSVSLESLRGAKLERLKKVVAELAKQTEILLIDSPAGLDRDAITALTMGNETILVVNPDIASLSDALKTKIISENLGANPIGIVISRAADKRVDLPKGKIASVLDLPVLAVIPEDPEVRHSTVSCEPVVLYEPKSPAARAFTKLTKDLLAMKPPAKPKKVKKKKR